LSRLTLTEQDSGREISVQIGDEVLVDLEENPSTGYAWALTSMIPGALEFQNSSFSPGEGGIGSGGRRSFVFRASAAGSTALELQLRRPWESGSPPEARFALVVHVR
jgi:inhibitor of cysteine peptidase